MTSGGRPSRNGASSALIVCLLAAFLASCGGGKQRRVEATTAVFVGPPFLDSTKLQAFGVGLGDSELQARKSIENAGLVWDRQLLDNPLVSARVWDSRGRMLMEVHTSAPPGGPPGKWNYFFHRIWNPPRYEYSVDMIAWHPDLKMRLPIKNQSLFLPAIVDQDSTLRRHLLGGEGERNSESPASSGVEVITYVFPKQGFMVKASVEKGALSPRSILFELIAPQK